MTPDQKKKLSITLYITGAVILIAGGITAYILLRPVPPPDPQDASAARKFVASDAFRKLPPKEQSNYVRRMRPARRPTQAEMQKMRQDMQKMPPEQRRAMMENMRRVFMREQEERLDKFFKMSKAEQIAELDRRIAEQDKRRAQRQNQRRQNNQQRQNNRQTTQQNNQNQTAAPDAANNNRQPAANNNQNSNQNRRQRPSGQMRREFESAISPAARAKFQQYRQMERLRRQNKLKVNK